MTREDAINTIRNYVIGKYEGTPNYNNIVKAIEFLGDEFDGVLEQIERELGYKESPLFEDEV